MMSYANKDCIFHTVCQEEMKSMKKYFQQTIKSLDTST